LGLSISSVDNT